MNTQPVAAPAAKPSLLSGVLQFIEAPAEMIVSSLVAHASPSAQPAVADALADPTDAKLEAAAEAVLDPMVRDATAALVDAVPLLGPILAPPAEALAVNVEHMLVDDAVKAGHVALAAIVARLQSALPKAA